MHFGVVHDLPSVLFRVFFYALCQEIFLHFCFLCQENLANFRSLGKTHDLCLTQHQLKGRVLLEVVVGEAEAVVKLLARKDEALLVNGDAFLLLDLCLHPMDW